MPSSLTIPTRLRSEIALEDAYLAKADVALFAHLASRGRWKLAKHLTLLADKLIDVAMGRTKRLIITMPPRHGKSELCSHYFPAWYLGNFPDNKIILASYEATYAASWGRKARDTFEEWAPALWNVNTASGSSAAASWGIQGHEGAMHTAGVGGPITGRGAHILLIDDPIKNSDDARSTTLRSKQKDWFQSTAYTRLESDPEGAIIIILTRWHEDDLAGWQLKEAQEEGGEQWEVLNLPAFAGVDDPLGRAPGEALWPRRFSADRLRRIQRALGSFWFEAMYQQSPLPPSGAVFNLDWFAWDLKPPREYDTIIQAWDTAQEAGQMNDYSVCATIGVVGNNAWLLNVFRDRLETPGLLKKAKELAHKYDPSVIVIEKASSGAGLLQLLRDSTDLPVVAVQTGGKDKVARARLVTPYMEGGRVFFTKGAWNAAFESELLRFPLDTHDDQVDAYVYAVLRAFGRGMRGIKVHSG